MKLLSVGLILGFVAGYAVTGLTQTITDTAVGTSCAFWLEMTSKDQGLGELSRSGYALGVMSAAGHEMFAFLRRGQSHLKNVGELVTALNARCASEPQKRLIDVALNLLGFR